MLKDISNVLDMFLRETGLDEHIARLWVYRGSSRILDFDYKGVQFAFDITPLINGRFRLEIVERQNSEVFSITTAPDKKVLVVDEASLDDVKEHLRERAFRLFHEIDAYLEVGNAQAEEHVLRVSQYLPSEKPRKVGVMTLPLNANYGGNLQAFALMEALRKLGHTPVFVNSRHPNRNTTPPKGASLPLLSDTVGLDPSIANSSFTDKYLQPVTREFTSARDLAAHIDLLGLDAVIVGSDQVWRPKFARTLLTNFYFCGFLPEDSPVKRISYAASFGVPHWEFSEEQTREASRLAVFFDGISVREDKAVELCREHLGVEPRHVLDPTLLLKPEDYQPILTSSSRKPNRGQILTYLLDVTTDKVSAVDRLAQSLSLGAYSTDGLPFSRDAAAQSGAEDKTVAGWLSSFQEAAFVITDSFHGVAFSILFNKPFIAYGNPGRGLARFTSILKMVGLEDRLVLKSADIDAKKMMRPIDWGAVNGKLERRRAESLEFLETSLTMPRKAGRKLPAQNLQTSEQAFDIRPEFKSNNAAWKVSTRGSTIILRVVPGGAVQGNIVACELPLALQSNKNYRIKLKWAFRSTMLNVRPCVRNPQTGVNHIIGNIRVGGKKDELHEDIIDFTVPAEGFTQFVLGAGSFTGTDGGADIVSMTLREIIAKPKAPSKPAAPSYAERAKFLALQDSERYSRAFTHGDAIGRARAHLMYFTHAIEKGLSHMEFRAGFGKAAVERLAKDTENWLAAKRSSEDQFFKAAISAMYSYFERHKEIGFDVSEYWKLFSPRVQSLISQASDEYGGVLEAAAYRESVPEVIRDHKFLEVVYGRRSIREFTSTTVRDADIQRAVQIAAQAPSVCNRQGPRVHHFRDPKQIHALVNLQGGFGGYKKPPTLLLVTCDLTAFTQPKERNQAFIDGGLFLMSLLLGLEDAGLGACPLNTTMDSGRESNMRKISNISETEVFIAFVAVGHYDPTVLIPRSVRYPLEDLLFQHDAAMGEKKKD
ncbi:polysaccharide pyruvyl transferase family protein [Salipiger abyssi]|uniref:polysaccharide pyruvyl transferase family protein n=1 Tax=Salipiger abyssi TaxID=1250539 RepID=UPI001A8FCE9F|nr:polysaccharide pyruvyl transferase family protein [Salipiger abyssi]MBN9890583.1 polysaccharide pyruvyl transferase family protein [Salipiger abyssi]